MYNRPHIAQFLSLPLWPARECIEGGKPHQTHTHSTCFNENASAQHCCSSMQDLGNHIRRLIQGRTRNASTNTQGDTSVIRGAMARNSLCHEIPTGKTEHVFVVNRYAKRAKPVLDCNHRWSWSHCKGLCSMKGSEGKLGCPGKRKSLKYESDNSTYSSHPKFEAVPTTPWYFRHRVNRGLFVPVNTLE